jgi:outer membrane biogenesis lipoprotein LolB
MPLNRRRLLVLSASALLAACGRKRPVAERRDLHPGETPEMRALI